MMEFIRDIGRRKLCLGLAIQITGNESTARVSTRVLESGEATPTGLPRYFDESLRAYSATRKSPSV